jgi:hypothetical protein
MICNFLWLSVFFFWVGGRGIKGREGQQLDLTCIRRLLSKFAEPRLFDALPDFFLEYDDSGSEARLKITRIRERISPFILISSEIIYYIRTYFYHGIQLIANYD